MSLFNKLTIFSILILILAAFVALPVMAHPHLDDPDTTDVDESDVDHEKSHHPMATITLTSANAAAFKTASVSGTDVVLVKTDGTGFAEVRATDATATPPITQDSDGKLKLRITFSQNLDTTDVLDAADITLTAVGKTTPYIDGSGWVGTPAFIADNAKTKAIDESKRVIEVEVTVPAAQFAELPITIYASVNLGEVGTSGVRTPSQVINGVEVAALNNLASKPTDAKFMIVAKFPESAKKPIIIMPTSAIKSVTHGMGEIGPVTSVSLIQLLTLTVPEDVNAAKLLDILSMGSTLARGALEITSGSKANEYVLAIQVEPIISTYELSVDDNADGTDYTRTYELHHADPMKANAKPTKIDMFTITVDNMGPKIMPMGITAPGGYPAAGGAFNAKIVFDEPPATMPTAANFMVTNGTLGNFIKVDAKTFIVEVTPATGVGADNADAMKKKVEIRLNAGLADEHGNPSVATAAADDADGVLTPTKGSTPTTPVDPGPVDPVVTDTANVLSGISVAAESYLILVHDNMDTKALPAVLPDKSKVMTWNGMPDLETLFFTGGSLSITRAKAPKLDHDNDDPDANGKKADGTTDASAPRDAGTRDIIITEIMAALNTAVRGTAEETAHQWIEIYNPLKVDVGGITISTKQGRPVDVASGAPQGEVLLDRFSNLVGVGWTFEGLGANGLSDNDPNTTNLYFVSFYRNNRGKNGWVKGHWSTSTEISHAGHKGTPGTKRRAPISILPTTAAPDRTPVIINEVGNHSNDKYNWIELRNVTSDVNQNLENWQISQIKAVEDEVELIRLPKKTINAGQVLLIVSSDPATDEDHPLATGYNIEKNDANQVNGVGPNHPVRYLVRKFELPASNVALILRNKHDKLKTDGHIEDLAGHNPNLSVSKTDFITSFWPLKNFGGSNSHNDLTEGKVHQRADAGRNGHQGEKNEAGKTAFREVGWTGIGYKRNATADNQNGGTPGYQNNVLQSEGSDATSPVWISEIMYDTSRNAPQWIEIQNKSNTKGINVDNWSLFIVNHDRKADGTDYTDGKLSERIDIDGRIPPKQTMLIVSNGARSRTMLPNERVWNLRRGRGAKLLNPQGFQITLKAKTDKGANEHQTVDVAGNLPEVPANNRRANLSYLDPAWMWPNGTDDRGDRVSVARKTDDKIKKQDANGKWNGTKKWDWILSIDDPRLSLMKGNNYYGHPSDISSPGETVGSPLPVTLSHFRPTLEDGKVVIRWTTESELDNAGFNILRSQDRNGEFTQVNDQLIQGKGTTAERSTYKWVDTSAKPGAVYYYQIEDVSFAGERNMLTTTKLKGLISAKNKLTTKWGELKEVQ